MSLETVLINLFSIWDNDNDILGDSHKNELLAIYHQIAPDADGNVTPGEVQRFWSNSTDEEKLIYSKAVIGRLHDFPYFTSGERDPKVPRTLKDQGEHFCEYIEQNYRTPYINNPTKVSDRQREFINEPQADRILHLQTVVSANHLYSKIAEQNETEKATAISEFINYQNRTRRSARSSTSIDYDTSSLSPGASTLVKTMNREVPFNEWFVSMVFEELINIGIEKGLYTKSNVPKLDLYKD